MNLTLAHWQFGYGSVAPEWRQGGLARGLMVYRSVRPQLFSGNARMLEMKIL